MRRSKPLSWRKVSKSITLCDGGSGERNEATKVVPGPRSVMHDSPDTMHLKAQFWTSPCGPKSSFGILEGKPNDAESRNVDWDV